MKNFNLYLLIIGVIFILGLAYASGVTDYFNLEKLYQQRYHLKDWAHRHPHLAPVSYLFLYFLFTLFSLPFDFFLCLLGGVLFPQPYCTIYAVIGATVGAIGLFLVTRSFLAPRLKKRAARLIHPFEKGFQENAACYLLFLRLTPLFPFWLVTMAPALLNVPLSTFIWTSFIGIIPCAFIFTQAGVGLDAMMNHSTQTVTEQLFSQEVILTLGVLALLSLTPLMIKKFFLKSKI